MTTKEWLPQPTKPKKKGDTRTLREGEPSILPMVRHGGDDFISTDRIVECCDCGLRHLHTYGVYSKGKRFFLSIRSWRL
jgi:hypothetical protein